VHLPIRESLPDSGTSRIIRRMQVHDLRFSAPDHKANSPFLPSVLYRTGISSSRLGGDGCGALQGHRSRRPLVISWPDRETLPYTVLSPRPGDVMHLAPTHDGGPRLSTLVVQHWLLVQCRLYDMIALICKAFCDCRPASVVWCCRAGGTCLLSYCIHNSLKINLIKEALQPGIAYAL
jgi:hypothetical protein